MTSEREENNEGAVRSTHTNLPRSASLRDPFLFASQGGASLLLQELRQVSDGSNRYRNLLVIRALLDDLSDTAQMIIASLEQTNDLDPLEARLSIDVAQRFIAELVLQTPLIAETVRDLEAGGFAEWERLQRWFISRPGAPSNSEQFRERARTSISALLRIITNITEKRLHRIDRSSDFRVLARWFAQTGSDAEAHLLWRTAFGLCPSRHLMIDDATLEDREAQHIPATTSWSDAPPLPISNCLRDSRGSSRTGGLSRIIDRTTEKEKLAAATHEEAQRLLNAQRRFGTGRMRLSELEHLETDEFEVFLDLLGDAVSARVFAAEPVEILSGDGSLRIRLEPTGDGREALILTAEGTFSGPDYWMSMEALT
jgi:uncharacterized protein (TIGR02677 family)